MNTDIIIPVRMKSVRLPGKPLALINDIPMMIHVGNQARQADVGKVIFACAEEELVDIANKHGFEAVLTDPDLQTGTDRVYQAYKNLNSQAEYIINVQGDLPFVKPTTIKAIQNILLNEGAEITTGIALLKNDNDNLNPSIVEVVVTQDLRALYFTRSPSVPYGEGPLYKHIGIYGYTAEALEKFVKLPQSPLEKRENLEQLRALENNMKIEVVIVDDFPQSVDTPSDLELVRKAAA